MFDVELYNVQCLSENQCLDEFALEAHESTQISRTADVAEGTPLGLAFRPEIVQPNFEHVLAHDPCRQRPMYFRI